MPVEVYLTVTDVHAAYGGIGFDVSMWFRSEHLLRTFVLKGIVIISREDEVQIEGATVLKNELGLSVEDGETLIRAACRTVWDTVILGDAVEAGSHWQPVTDWLPGYFEMAAARELAKGIENALLKPK